MKNFLAGKGVYIAVVVAALFFAANMFFIVDDKFSLLLIPAGIFVAWLFLTHRDESLFFMALCTPFAINMALIGDMSLSVPSEPLMIMFCVIFIFQELLMRSYDSRLLKHPITIILFISLAWMAFTSAVSLRVMESFKYTANRLWYVIPFYYATLQSFSGKTKNIKYFYWAYAISLGIIIAFTSHKTFNSFGDLQMLHRVMRPFYNDHTAYGCVIAFFLPMAAYFSFKPKQVLWKRVAAIVLLGLLVMGLWLSYCRAAWLSVIGALFVYVLIRLGVRIKWMVFAVAVLVGLFFAFKGDIMYNLGKNSQDSSFTFSDQVKSISNISTDASNLERINRWSCAFRMWKNQPITGVGPGAYQFVYGPYQKREQMTIISTNDGNMGNAHSEYIGALCEQGVPGAIFVLLLFIVTFLTGDKIWRRAIDREKAHLALVLAVSLFTYYVHGMLNNFLDTDKLSVPFWAFTAAIVALDLTTEKTPKKKWRWKERKEK